MGVFIDRSSDTDLYKDAYEEAQRIIRISEEVRITLEKIINNEQEEFEESLGKLTTSKLARKIGLKTDHLLEKLLTIGYLELKERKHYLTAKGKEIGGEFRMSKKFGSYFLCPENLTI